MEIRGARANNLRGEAVRFPLGSLVGVCGPSGSGKSTLVIDSLGRALAPKKQTTSVAYEPVAPGEHDAILGAPGRAILVDQARAGVTNPADFLGLSGPLRQLYASSEDARALGLDEAWAAARPGRGRTIKTFPADIFSPVTYAAGRAFCRSLGGACKEGAAQLFGFRPTSAWAMNQLARPLAAALWAWATWCCAS
jgi:energy-coupling factor transporter ATP-binding protein EcfA2